MTRSPIPALLADWFAGAARDLPWRHPTTTPWGVLVSEFMLQQTQAERVAPRWIAFLERWPDAAALADASDADVLRAWDRLGYPRRALRLRACAVAIATEHEGLVPRDEATLRALPGVGPYTAAAVASFAYGVPTAVVDTNVRRVLARAVLGVAEAWAPHAARDEAEYRGVVPVPDTAGDIRAANVFNAAAMELGALVCTARSPRCDACPLVEVCAWQLAGKPAGTSLGAPRKRQAAYAGSDREMRGRILRELRSAHAPVASARVRQAVVDATRHEDDHRYRRAIDSLLADGLIERHGRRLALPGEAGVP